MEYEDRKNLVKKENPLVKYARKQFEAMEEEVTKRNALKRVERMLQGTEEVKPKSYDNILTSRKSARPHSSSSINIATPSKPPTSPILSHSSKETYGGDGSNSQGKTDYSTHTNRVASASSNTRRSGSKPRRPWKKLSLNIPSSEALSLNSEMSNPPGSLTDRSHSTSTKSSHKENRFIEDAQQPKQNNKYQSRYSQSALEAERKKKKLEYSSFVVSTGTKKKKRTNVFARRQKAKMLQAKREREELANRRKSQRTSKNLEAAREMLRLKALRERSVQNGGKF